MYNTLLCHTRSTRAHSSTQSGKQDTASAPSFLPIVASTPYLMPQPRAVPILTSNMDRPVFALCVNGVMQYGLLRV